MAIPNPNPNIADYQKSDNKTYSSNKIEALIKTATELPIPAAGDAGKVLTVNDGATGYELDTPLTIDDTAASDSTTYSSSKIESEIESIADSEIEDYLSYSETEKKIGKWIDGSDLYEKVVPFGALPSTASTGSYPLNITASNIVSFICFFTDGYNILSNSLPSYILRTGSSWDLKVVVSSDRSTYTNNHVILRYTKSA